MVPEIERFKHSIKMILHRFIDINMATTLQKNNNSKA